jgi:hypothetical protein
MKLAHRAFELVENGIVPVSVSYQRLSKISASSNAFNRLTLFEAT